MTRLRKAIARKGAAGVLREALTNARRMVTHEDRLLIFNAPVSSVLRVEPRLEPGMVFETEVVSPEDGVRLAASRADLRSVMQVQLEVERGGEELMVGLVDGRLAAWAIVACGSSTRWPLTETGSDLPLEPNDAVFTAGFVVPELRGRHLFQTMYGAAADRAAARGAHTLWSWCEHHNSASRGAMLAVGFKYRGSHARRTTLGIRGTLRIEHSPTAS